MTIANLEKLSRLIKNNNDNLPFPTPPSSKVKGIFAPKKSLDYGCYFLTATRRPRSNHGGR